VNISALWKEDFCKEQINPETELAIITNRA